MNNNPNYPITILDKTNNVFIEEIQSNILLNDKNTIIRYNVPGEWYYIDQTTLPVLKTIIYNIVLLDADNATDISLLRNIEGYLLNIHVFTYDTALTLLSKLIVTQINTNKYKECLGIITDELLIKYIKVFTLLIMEHPKWKFIIDYFIMATREIYKNKNEYNKKIVSTEKRI